MNEKNGKKPLLGIIGGLGPMASAYFLETVTAHTRADCDQEHINIILSSRAETPDRTAFILGKSDKSPLPYMIEDAKRLEAYGADFLLMPCNTAHYFIDEIRNSVTIPVPSIIEETCEVLRKAGVKKAGIMATEGTISAKAYQTKLEERGIGYEIPDEKHQQYLNELIYDCVKSGKEPDFAKYYAVRDYLKNLGCERMILGCTELSVVHKNAPDKDLFIDSLEVLAAKAIKLCSSETVGFPDEFDLI